MRFAGVVCAVSIVVTAGSTAVAGEIHETGKVEKFNVLSHVPAQALTASEKKSVRGAFTLVLPTGVERTISGRENFANRSWSQVLIGPGGPGCQVGSGCW